MNETKIEKLKKLWEKYENTWNGIKQYKLFIEKYPKDVLEDLTLDEYTNIKKGNIEYFTNFIERETENCGKFRTASSFAYGVYKVNEKSIKDKIEQEQAKDKYRSLEQKSQKDLKYKYIDKDKAEKYFKDKIISKLKELVNFSNIEDIKPLDINYARKVAYLYNPDKLIPIYKKDVLVAIAEFFSLKDEIDFKSYKATETILKTIKEVFDIKEELNFDLTQKIGAFLWENFGKSVSFDSKNIIYYGAPGTGKTYTVYNAIRQKVLQAGDNIDDVTLFTQFHPSFGYEDFIDGLKPHVNKGAIELKLTNGIFKEFCKKAIQTLKEERKEGKKDNELTSYYFVADEINRAELSTVFGELLVCLEEDKRVDFEGDESLKDGSMLIETQNSYQDKKDTALYFENNKCKFGIPTNLYFIGTMNDIDRSIDSFDLALRRRFIWERMDFDDSVIVNDYKFNGIAEEDMNSYINKCKKLNNYISIDLGLGKSYEIGHAYFMDVKVHNNKISNTALQNLFSKKLKPLIEEYLRGEYSQSEIEDKLKTAENNFKI